MALGFDAMRLVRVPPVADLVELRAGVRRDVGIGTGAAGPRVDLRDRQVQREVALVRDVDRAVEGRDPRGHGGDLVGRRRAGELRVELVVGLDAHRGLLEPGERHERRRVRGLGHPLQRGGHLLRAARPRRRRDGVVGRRVGGADDVAGAGLVGPDVGGSVRRRHVRDETILLRAHVDGRVRLALDRSREVRDLGKRQRRVAVLAADRDARARREDLEPVQHDGRDAARGDRERGEARLHPLGAQRGERRGVEIERLLSHDRGSGARALRRGGANRRAAARPRSSPSRGRSWRDPVQRRAGKCSSCALLLGCGREPGHVRLASRTPAPSFVAVRRTVEDAAPCGA